MNIVHGARYVRQVVDAAGNFVRHGQYDPNMVDNVIDFGQQYRHQFGLLGGVLVATGGAIASHSTGQQVQSRINFKGGKKRSSSQANLPPSEQMSTHRRINTGEGGNNPPDGPTPMAVASSSGHPAEHKGRQTQITPIPRHVKMGMPEYFTTKHVWSGNVLTGLGVPLTINKNAVEAGFSDFTIRLNSVWDIFPLWSSNQSPNWRDHFAQMYDYYTVLSCEVELTAYVSPSNSYRIPTVWMTNTYGSDQPTYTVNYLKLREDLNVNLEAITMPHPGGGATDDVWQVFHYHKTFTHSDYEKNITEIKQDSNDQIWTEVNASPDLSHTLRIMPRLLYDSGIGADKPYVCHARIIYEVQYKESKVPFKFGGPTSVPNNYPLT